MRILNLTYKRTRAGGEVIVELEDRTTITVDAELAVQFRLATGGELQDAQKQELLQQNERLMARRRLIRYIAMRRKTVAESRRYLREHKFSDDAIDSAIDVALEQGYLDDTQYAEAYVRTQEKTSRKGPRAVRQELLARGIDKESAASAIQPLADPTTQREAAAQLALKKLPSLRRDNELIKARQKLQMLLLRKGYDPDIAAEVTRELLGETSDLDD